MKNNIKKRLSFILAVLMIFTMLPLSSIVAFADSLGGSTADFLFEMTADGEYYLTEDIDLSGVDISTDYIMGNGEMVFTGKFHGQGYTIKNVPADKYLIDTLGDGAIFENVKIEYVSAGTAIKAANGGATADAVTVTNATLIGTAQKNGNASVLVNACTVEGSVSNAGLLGGYDDVAIVKLVGCTNNASVSGTNAGGFIGTLTAGKSLTAQLVECKNTGTVSGTNVGGFIGGSDGKLLGNVTVVMAGCESTGTVSGANAGGFVGYVATAVGSKVTFDLDECIVKGASISGSANAAGIYGLLETKQASDRLDANNCDIVNTTVNGGEQSVFANVSEDSSFVVFTDCVYNNVTASEGNVQLRGKKYSAGYKIVLASESNVADSAIKFVGIQTRVNAKVDDNDSLVDVRFVAVVNGTAHNKVGYFVNMIDEAGTVKSAYLTVGTVYRSIIANGETKTVKDLDANAGDDDYISVISVSGISATESISFEVTPYVLAKDEITVNLGATKTTQYDNTVLLSLADEAVATKYNSAIAGTVSEVKIDGNSVAFTTDADNKTITVAGSAISAISLKAGNKYKMELTTENGTYTSVAAVYTDVLYTHEDLVNFKSKQSSTDALTGIYVLGNDIVAPTNGYKLEGGYRGKWNTWTATYGSTGGFRGTFDGRGYAIDGYTFGAGGLFGDLQWGAVVKNLGITNATVTDNGASLLGCAIFQVTVTDCVFEAKTATVASCYYLFGYYTDAYNKRNEFTNITANIEWSTNSDNCILGVTVNASTFTNFVINQTGTITNLIKGSEATIDGITFGEPVETIGEFAYSIADAKASVFGVEVMGEVTGVTVDGTEVAYTHNEDDTLSLEGFEATAGTAYYMVIATKYGKYTYKLTAYDDVIFTHEELVEFSAKQSKTNAVTGSYALGCDIYAPSGYTTAFGSITGDDRWITAWNTFNGYTGGFRGTFDGRGCSIVGYNFASGGLFGYLHNGSVVKNLNFDDVAVTANGGSILAQSLFYGTVTDCVINASQTNTSICGGALFYSLCQGTISNIEINVDWNSQSANAWIVACNIKNEITASNITVNQIGTNTALFSSMQSESNDDNFTLFTAATSDTVIDSNYGESTLQSIRRSELIGNTATGTIKAVYTDSALTHNIYEDGVLNTYGMDDGRAVLYVVTTTATYTVSAEIATKVLMTDADLQAFHTLLTKEKVDGYFTLGADIAGTTIFDVDTKNTWTDANGSFGFAGTFDGKGYMIDGYTFCTYGLFVDLFDGAVVRNLIMNNVKTYRNGSRILAQFIGAATVENCQINASSTNTSDSCESVFAYQVCGSVFKDITVSVDWAAGGNGVLGQYSSAIFENVIVNQSGTAAKTFDNTSSTSGIDSITWVTSALPTVEAGSIATFNLRCEDWWTDGVSSDYDDYVYNWDTNKYENTSILSSDSFEPGTYTIDGDNCWSNRWSMVTEWIDANYPDIICFQEVSPSMYDDLKTKYGDTYTFVGEGNRDEDYFTCAYNLIAYKTAKYELVETSTVTINDTSSNLRIYTRAELSPVSGALDFVVYNTHISGFTAGLATWDTALAEWTALTSAIAGDTASNKLVYLAGDLNTAPDGWPSDLSCYGLYDISADIDISYNSFGGTTNSKADYILCNRDIRSTVKVDKVVENGIYISDHYPITVSISEQSAWYLQR